MPRFQAYSPSRSSVWVSRAGDQRSQLGAHRKQAGRLAIHQLHAIGFGDIDAADALELQQFAFDHHLGEADEQVENLEVALAQRDLEGLHVEPVAGQHAGVIAPLHVGRGPPAARFGGVDHIVMHQRGGVDHLHHRAQLDGARAGRRPASLEQSSSSAGRSRLPPLDCRYCPMAVTASTDATDSRRDLLFHLLQIVLDQVENLLAGNGLPELAQIHVS